MTGDHALHNDITPVRAGCDRADRARTGERRPRSCRSRSPPQIPATGIGTGQRRRAVVHREQHRHRALHRRPIRRRSRPRSPARWPELSIDSDGDARGRARARHRRPGAGALPVGATVAVDFTLMLGAGRRATRGCWPSVASRRPAAAGGCAGGPRRRSAARRRPRWSRVRSRTSMIAAAGLAFTGVDAEAGIVWGAIAWLAGIELQLLRDLAAPVPRADRSRSGLRPARPRPATRARTGRSAASTGKSRRRCRRAGRSRPDRCRVFRTCAGWRAWSTNVPGAIRVLTCAR